MNRVSAVALLTIVAMASAFGQRGEGARIAIKRALDPAAATIPKTPVKTTVEDLLAAVRPPALQPDSKGAEYQNRRIGPLENTMWQVTATIKQIILRADGDYYMVIEGASGARTVVEVPDPRLCPKSKLIKQIQHVRNMLAKRFGPTPMPQDVNQKATITGVGFFGMQGRSLQGRQNNGARLMPGIDISFDK
ncbi:hypothetical protein [Fimbriimonas ginsengisoli]|uniref:Uncharacterized protein n=1 Tax=Fimbriimonas ginsengisoli Gsoil 348 TaxID=661478 RepID=A0A068NXR6_FIMGI|nr:hypothetical protein [Fimbriimonas ginsengisoli]AIE88137.1 hypothetical protein OP10G_4769 [Fimbriimonas ginsengisoli Gsoil 348]